MYVCMSKKRREAKFLSSLISISSGLDPSTSHRMPPKKRKTKSCLATIFRLLLNGPQGRAHSSKGAKRPRSYLLQTNQPFGIFAHRFVEGVAGVGMRLRIHLS